jgi:hypothetical protein
MGYATSTSHKSTKTTISHNVRAHLLHLQRGESAPQTAGQATLVVNRQPGFDRL